MIRYYWVGVDILIINQLLPIALFIAIPSFQAGNLIQLLGISGATIAFGFRDILENLLAGILILLLAPAEGYKPATPLVSRPKF
jgi:small-conductance mechanosensitive channel